MGAEIAGALAARYAAPAVAGGALVLRRAFDPRRGGDTLAAQAGRRAHQAFKAKVDAKPGWKAEQNIPTPNGVVRPDARGPVRNAVKPDNRYQLELKPDTITGRRAGEKAVGRYTRETNNKTRAVYYDPKDYK
jgi:hypothetical protein